MRNIGAGKGTRSKKSGQSIYFIGYKKHTLYGMVRFGELWRPVPLCSMVKAAHISEVRVLKPLLNFARRRLLWPMQFIVVDRGFVDGKRSGFLRRHWNVAIVLYPKINMVPPEGTDTDGCPMCPKGERLVLDDYDYEDGNLIYIGDHSKCHTCPLSGNLRTRNLH